MTFLTSNGSIVPCMAINYFAAGLDDNRIGYAALPVLIDGLDKFRPVVVV